MGRDRQVLDCGTVIYVVKGLQGVVTLIADDLCPELGYHSYNQIVPWQTYSDDVCRFLDQPCWYDGSGLNASCLIESAHGNEDLIWKELERYFDETFYGR